MEEKFTSKGSTLKAVLMQVIKTTSVVGDGTDQNPNRYETRYWSLEGQLLALSIEDVEFLTSLSSLDLRK